MNNRLDGRLKVEHRRHLEELALDKGVPISEVVRSLIGGTIEEVLQERRRRTTEHLTRMNIEDPPDSESLSRQLEEAHEPGGIH